MLLQENLMICPICNNETKTNVCSSCGYDRSSDGEQLPSLAVFPMPPASKSARIRKRYEATAERCAALERRVDALEACVRELQDRINGTIPSSPVPSREAKPAPAHKGFGASAHDALKPTPAASAAGKQKPYAAGDVINFGKYIQKSVSGALADDIEWIVYKADADKLWLISKKILEWKSMSPAEKCDWKDTKLRSWLNGEFLNKAFNDSEKERMLSMNEAFAVKTASGTAAASDEDSINNDKVFLLSKNAYHINYSAISSHKCEPTAYVRDASSFLVNGDWWLSNVGEYDAMTATTVAKSGEIRNVWKGYLRGVRPIIFIKR